MYFLVDTCLSVLNERVHKLLTFLYIPVLSEVFESTEVVNNP